MTKILSQFLRSLLISLSWVMVIACLTTAAPQNGEIMAVEQPDGSMVDVRVFGDEFYIRGEGLDGYTLIRDPKTGFICYAALAIDSSKWVSTGLIYHGISSGRETLSKGSSGSTSSNMALALKAQGITPGLDLKPEVRRNLRKRAIHELGLDVDSEMELNSVDPSAQKRLQKSSGSAESSVDTVKKVTGVIVLVEFPDSRATFSRAQMNDFGNQKGFNVNGNNGSIRDYFLDVSHGKFEYNLTVTEYYLAKNKKSYYDSTDGYRGGKELVKEALEALEAKGFDFSSLTTSTSGSVLGVNILFAGSAGKNWGEGIWAHRSSIATLNFDGVKVNRYMLTNIGTQLTIGTFLHESGHLLFNWPDLYDYDQDSRGAGGYCLMSAQKSKNPQPPNPHFRIGQAWEPVIELEPMNDEVVSLPSNGRANYRLLNQANAKESYLIENIANQGRWANMPDHGLMIWHVEEGGNNSWQERTLARHYRVSVLQADGKLELEANLNGGGPNDLFHSGNNAAFTSQTVPNSRWWSGESSGLDIINISAVKDTMTFQFTRLAVGLAGKTDKEGKTRLSSNAWKSPFNWSMNGRRVKVSGHSQTINSGLVGK